MNKKLAQIVAGGPAFAISPGLAIGASPGLAGTDGIALADKSYIHAAGAA